MDITAEILYKEILKGNKAAFNTLFRMYYPVLVTYARRYVPMEDAENIVQDVMLYIWENRRRLNISCISSYLYSSVRNRSLTLISHDVTKKRIHDDILKRLSEVDESDAVLMLELMEKLDDALSQMRTEYREAFELNRFHDKSYKEIADIKNVSTKTVDFRIQQALKTLRVALGDFLK